MASNPTSRANFISTSVTFLKKWNFDGLDIDWEYPTDRALYTTFITELKTALQPYGLLLTAAVGVGIIFYFILNFNKKY
jgi:chitinase